MIDFILWTFFFAVFYGGFWCGAKFGTLKGMGAAIKVRFRSWLNT